MATDPRKYNGSRWRVQINSNRLSIELWLRKLIDFPGFVI